VPRYQYACTDCGEQLEVHQSFTDDALTVCPGCEGRLRKVFNAVGVVFKGSGFYKTDSRKAPAGTGAGSSESGSSGKDSAGSSAGKDSSNSSSGDKGGSSNTSSDKSAGKSSAKSSAA
jgi:putative FmdB family regulatory protein